MSAYWGASNNGPWGSGNQGYSKWMSGGAGAGTVVWDGGASLKKPPAPQQAPGLQPPGPFDWASQMQAPAANPHITTGITARPVYNQQQINGALSKFSSMAPPATGGPLGNTAANLYGQEAGRARLNADRGFSAANADMLLKSQTAQSQAGLGWGRLANQQNSLADNQSLNQDQLSLALLRALGVM